MDAAKPESDLLLRLLSATELRSRVIASNIANQNTPGYTREEVRFEELLRDAMRRGATADRVAEVDPRVVKDLTTPARQDGNNVSLELELNALRENRMLFETYTSLLDARGTLKKIALGAG